MIYVVDSADRDRMGISKSELYAMLEVRTCVRAYMHLFVSLCVCVCVHVYVYTTYGVL